MAPSNKKKNKKKDRNQNNGSNNNTIATTTTTTTNIMKKKQQPRKCTIDELCIAAEHSINVLNDIKNAITLYSIIIQRLLAAPAPGIQQQDQQQQQQPEPEQLIIDIYEKRAELYIETQQTELAIQDYQMILQYYSSNNNNNNDIDHDHHHDTMTTTPTGTTTTTYNGTEQSNTAMIHQLRRKATIYMSIGQLCQAEKALQSYEHGKLCIQKAISLLIVQLQHHQQQQSNVNVDVIIGEGNNNNSNNIQQKQDEEDDQQEQLLYYELQQQYCSICCSIAELYLTDLCYTDNAEMNCELILQDSIQQQQQQLSVFGSTESTTTTTTVIQQQQQQQPQQQQHIETIQLLASLRLSQKRNTEARVYIQQVYDSIAIGCQALATLVGLRTNNNEEDNNMDDNNNGGAIELMALDHVQSLPSIEFRIQTSKLLLECAGTLPYQHQQIITTTKMEADTTTTATVVEDTDMQDDNDNVNNTRDDVRDYTSTIEQQQYAIMAIDVIGSCLAEQDEMYECWILLGDAMIYIEKQNAYPYWNRAYQLLLPIQQQLAQEQENYDTTKNNNTDDNIDIDDDDDNDPIQQQLDTIMMELDQLQERIDWAIQSGYDKSSSLEEDNIIIE